MVDENRIEEARQIIKESNHIVVLSGRRMMLETGLIGRRAEERVYEIEEEFGYSPEEILTSAFWSRRTELFFDYYKRYVLVLESMKPTDAHYAIAKLEQQGKLLTVITRTIYGLHQMAGITKVIEIHGSVHRNVCPKCGKNYDADYIVNAKGVPKCEHCQIVIQPKFCMFGEKVDNGKVSQSADAIGKADLAIMAGASIDSSLGYYVRRYYHGKHIILIDEKLAPGDDVADIILQGNCQEILPKIIY